MFRWRGSGKKDYSKAILLVYNKTMVITDGQKKFRLDGELAQAVRKTIQEHGVACVKMSNDNAQHEVLDKAISAVRKMFFVGDYLKDLVVDELTKLKNNIGSDINNDSSPLCSVDEVVGKLSGQKPTTLP